MLRTEATMEATLGIIILENLMKLIINYNSFGSLNNEVECYK
jgi:hypothetical protein